MNNNEKIKISEEHKWIMKNQEETKDQYSAIKKNKY